MTPTGQIISPIIFDIASRALKQAVDSTSVPLHSEAPAVAAREVANTIVERIEEDPRIQHVTNTEPWYRSRVTVGAIVSGLATLGGVAGFALAPEDVDVIVGGVLAAGALYGNALTLWGRWKAKRPIGA